ncbi:hypothetical protein FA10DRAFT_269859 [Acaromyces ingoldii]|uniref:Uncharacterized protein n=1 Tax=Acaromyces ingoldii TaxID=215250 RepID=A0A316YBT6_9BASI|nr:hypothetical protein FA10DRAFT_269859 [Acaromyces ingoldii]PWN86752.1 hypothetical protein FA10DRAFT_269859 [Acaromyces ingoldii]
MRSLFLDPKRLGQTSLWTTFRRRPVIAFFLLGGTRSLLTLFLYCTVQYFIRIKIDSGYLAIGHGQTRMRTGSVANTTK